MLPQGQRPTGIPRVVTSRGSRPGFPEPGRQAAQDGRIPHCPARSVRFRTGRRKGDRLRAPLSDFLGRALPYPLTWFRPMPARRDSGDAVLAFQVALRVMPALKARAY